MVKVEELGKQEYGNQAGEHTRGNAAYDSGEIPGKKLHLFVQRHRQTDGGRCEEEADIAGSLHVILVGKSCDQQKYQNQGNGDK